MMSGQEMEPRPWMNALNRDSYQARRAFGSLQIPAVTGYDSVTSPAAPESFPIIPQGRSCVAREQEGQELCHYQGRAARPVGVSGPCGSIVSSPLSRPHY